MDFHIAQVGFFNPVLDGLQQAGVNIDRLLRLSGLDKFQLDDVEHYVPVDAMYTLFDEIQCQEGIDDLVEQFAEKIDLATLSNWGEMVAYTPDVLSALQLATQYSGVTLSHERAGFEINGTTTTYWQRFIDQPAIGRQHADFVSFALAVKGFQLSTGPDWQPLEIHLQSHTAPNLDILLPSASNTKVFLGQSATAIKFPTAMLTMPMLGENAPPQLMADFTNLVTLSTKITHLLDSKQNALSTNIKLIAEMTNTSTRTLQRNLAEEGTSISEVIDQWRFKKALKLLDDPNMRIKDISEQLGYAVVSNFDRTFRRWTNTTPNSYRDRL